MHAFAALVLSIVMAASISFHPAGTDAAGDVVPIADATLPATAAPTAAPTAATAGAVVPTAVAAGPSATPTQDDATDAISPSPSATPPDGSLTNQPSAATDSDGDGLANAFEQRYGLNPQRKDSNGDGLLDPAEDPDHDGLGNLGEQRFGTSPRNPDTDGDGLPDGREDANHNGITNAREQDRRPVPAGLKPSLTAAPHDLPVSYGDGCHSRVGDARIHPCTFGGRTGMRTVALFGDSHAAEWLAALIRAGQLRHWRIVNLTKTGCPSVTLRIRARYARDIVPCRTWRTRGEAWLRAHPPGLVLISNFRGYTLLDKRGHLVPGSRRERVWRSGLQHTLRALPAASKRVVLADTPLFPADPRRCLSHHPGNISACEKSRASASSPKHDAAEKAAAAATGATFTSMNGVVCSYDPCPIVVGRFLLWRDRSHLTATYSRQLGPALAMRLAAILQRKAATTR